MDELRKAVEAAGQELQRDYGWTLDEDRDTPISDSCFFNVVIKHMRQFVGPEASEILRKARISALRAELAELE